ncbi:hypothetical protein THAOC_14854 [Thalassiosira oceanica]|uniref:Uncharacterized protein n=1 Tax=Thalassiosira oceanica TaxID=159749 RepID=K0STR1_THAOC|nr:hypothetical protein THAOC_14854 [Thalassiosira oceanica]|eukprot:EJK64411.1 hypothetical protein THAOC_14854 [Thalassiosira oceanica]
MWEGLCKDTLVSNLQLMFERIEYVNIDAKGNLKDWIKYAQDASVWKELIQCMLDPQRELPARPNWGSRIAAIEVRIVSLTHLAKDGSNPAHGKKEQADDHHPELAEKKNLPEDNGTQKVSDGTSLI